MRSSKSRSRNKSNRNRNTGSLGNVVNRVFDSNGPEGKVRGTPQQIIDKYNQLARDSALGNDRVATENFQQHAEHYMRMLSEAQKEQDAKREAQERENRERQAQRDRDRERSERDTPRPRRDDDNTGPQDAAGHDRAGSGDQPDVLDLRADDDGPGLVETPESRDAAQPAAEDKPKPKKPRAPRKPRVKKPVENQDAGGSDAPAAPAPQPPTGDTPDAAE
ncbi:DUF4167 domain-containing protein [Tropicibacter oceani]|uniref:DUF4167 domain-containing protein n=1 Tax=Tropicibacter oceani TaxID=3058420 RepID=A0ABY8QCY2_9RHOB|nr:DUF4167 domain-containing protein [Tropicibacter oceani]WGW02486.1 DUF4167 domain-containing protein [Tropicibacter oceani]